MSDNNYYWGAWRSGIQQGFSKPIIGLGPSSHPEKIVNKWVMMNNSKPIYTN